MEVSGKALQDDPNNNEQERSNAEADKNRPEQDDASSLPLVSSLEESANITSSNSAPICRICFSATTNGENLLKPCKCKGTMRFVHRSCLESWLTAQNVDVCELCHHHFTVERRRMSFCRWFWDPSAREDRRNLISDIGCFICLTPLGLASFWLCIQGAVHFYGTRNGILEAASLMAICVILVVAYVSWIVMATKYHFKTMSRWLQTNWHIAVIDVDQINTPGNEPDPGAPEDRSAARSICLNVSDNRDNERAPSDWGAKGTQNFTTQPPDRTQ